LVPGERGPRHIQLYFYDIDETIRHIIQRSPNLDEGLIRTVLQILDDNPYVHAFRSLGDVSNLDEYKIELNTDIGVDQRRYNAPTVLQVAAIREEGTDTKRNFRWASWFVAYLASKSTSKHITDVMILFHIHCFIGVDQRRYNAPTVLQVAAIWEEGTDTKRNFRWASWFVAYLASKSTSKHITDVMILFHIHCFFREVRPVGTRKYYMPIREMLPKILQVP
jgi:hypothetical protein